MPNGRFEGVPRGRALSGSRAISEYLFNTPTKAETVAGLDRKEFGFLRMGRELTGFTGWIDYALERRVVGDAKSQSKPAEATATEA